jgi:hypothetical protein
MIRSLNLISGGRSFPPQLRFFLYSNWKVIHVSINFLNTSHNIVAHILNDSNVLRWNFMFVQSPSHHISWYFDISLL